jgi:hypothetical protein
MSLILQIALVRLTLVVPKKLIIALSPIFRVPLSVRDFVHIDNLDPLARFELRQGLCIELNPFAG